MIAPHWPRSCALAGLLPALCVVSFVMPQAFLRPTCSIDACIRSRAPHHSSRREFLQPARRHPARNAPTCLGCSRPTTAMGDRTCGDQTGVAGAVDCAFAGRKPGSANAGWIIGRSAGTPFAANGRAERRWDIAPMTRSPVPHGISRHSRTPPIAGLGAEELQPIKLLPISRTAR